MKRLNREDAFAYLTKKPNEMLDAWDNPQEHIAGALFDYVSQSGEMERTQEGSYVCGCLTEVKSGRFAAKTYELTELIRADDRIPSSGAGITVEHLPVLLEWQNRIEKEWRKPGLLNYNTRIIPRSIL